MNGMGRLAPRILAIDGHLLCPRWSQAREGLHELTLAVALHAGNAEEIYGRMGFKPQCRQCLEDAEDVIADERACALA